MAIDTRELEGTKKKELHIFYVLDTSGSMHGDPMGSLNDGMRSTVEELRKKDGEKADFRIGVLEFNSDVRWVTAGNNGIETLQDFFWTDLSDGGLTYLGKAMRELNKSLSRNDKMKAETGNKVPVIIFMSDGYPNDDWETALQELAKNKWYQQAIKIAFALGDKADADVLAKVVGVRKDGSIVPDYEAVLKTNNLDVFARMIQAVSVTASLAASTSQMVDTELDGSTIVKDVLGANLTDPIGGDPNPGPIVIPDPQDDPPIYGNPGDTDFGVIDDFGDIDSII